MVVSNLKYEIGSNSVSSVCQLESPRLTANEVLDFLIECIGSKEIVLFHYLLQLEGAMLPPPEKLSEPFLLACTAGELAHVSALLDFGINPSIQSRTRETALSSAAAWGNDSVIVELLSRGAKFRSTSVKNNEELSLIIKNCCRATIFEVLDENPSFLSDQNREKVIILAEDLGRIDISTFLSGNEL